MFGRKIIKDNDETYGNVSKHKVIENICELTIAVQYIFLKGDCGMIFESGAGNLLPQSRDDSEDVVY
jgi:hypothetical protein